MKRGAESMEEAAAKRRCPTCLKWYMGTGQRDRHVAKMHPERAGATRSEPEREGANE